MLLAGLVAAALLWWFLKSAAKANPARLARLVKQGGGALAFGAALLLALRGRFDMAMLLTFGGAWLFGWNGIGLSNPFNRGSAAGAVSRVRTAMIEMEIGHRSGAMSGTVLAGPFLGRALSDLGPVELRHLAEACRRDDPDGERLLQAYLDRRFAGRREDAEGHRYAGARPNPQSGAMTQEEAYEILGLQPGSEAEAIRRAHRNLMKKLHPDQGGSTYLASRVNQAKDVLLNRHR
jgi:hypothetical protein